MTDIHSHILFGVDDGSDSVEESILILKKLKSVGFDKVILTPHFILDSNYNSKYADNLKRFFYLKNIVKDNDIGIDIFLGNEIYINEHIIELLDNNIISSLNGTQYVLIEFSLYNKILNLEDILYNIKCQGYQVVIAHPERYDYFQNDYKFVDRLRKDGFFFQSNYSSILGYYGVKAKKLIKYMLKKHYIDFLGTDIHKNDKDYVITNFDIIEKKIKKITGDKYYKTIQVNCDKLIGS